MSPELETDIKKFLTDRSIKQIDLMNKYNISRNTLKKYIEYIAYTMLIDRSINPTATVEGLIPIRIEKLEIIRDGEIVETIVHK